MRFDDSSILDHDTSAARRAMSRSLLALTLACAVARGVVGHDPFPYWTEDPTILAVPTAALLPVGSVLLSVVAIIAAGLSLAVRPHAVCTDRWPLAEPILFLVGFLGVIAHAFAIRGGSLDNLQTGLLWAAAFASATAASAARHDHIARRMVLASLLGGLVLIAGKCLVQVFVELPATLATFEATKQEVFASRGWSPDSPQARAFEHRLRQPDATAWFGLSNVVATFGAFATIAAFGLWLSIFKPRSMGRGVPPHAHPLSSFHLLALLLISLAGASLLILGGSKGGYAAAIVGSVVLVASFITPRWSLFRWTPLLAAVAVFTALAVRGLLGESLGERSLLFRAFYAEASARILLHNLPWGTGPDAYRDAYMLFKNPLSPEEITSPHNIILDLLCTLGVTGVAWTALWLLWVHRLGRGLVASSTVIDTANMPPDLRREIRAIFLLFAAATLLGAFIELPAATPESAVMRFAGLFLATLFAAGLLPWFDRPAASHAIAAASISLALLGLIDMAPINPGSASWYAMLLAVAAPPSPAGEPAPQPSPATRRLWWLTPALAAAAGLAALPSLLRWQSNLKDAFETVAIPSRLRAETELLFRTPNAPAPEIADLRARLAEQGIAWPPPGPEVFEPLRLVAMQQALPALQAAAADQPTHTLTREAASRLQLQIATVLNAQQQRQPALEAAAAALATAVPLATSRPPSASTLAWQATVMEQASLLRNDPPHLWVPLTQSLLEAAAAADPHNHVHPKRLAELLAGQSRPADAAFWANKALELNQNNRLDPSGTRTLTPAEIANLNAIISAAKPTAPEGQDPIKTRPPG
jgi:hypothetical protein